MNPRHSLRRRMLQVIGGTIAVLLVVLLLVVFTIWRNILINDEIEHVVAVARSFSVFVLDSMIYGSTLNLEKEYILESYITDYLGRDREIIAITVLDDGHHLVASSDYALYAGEEPAAPGEPALESSVQFTQRAGKGTVLECAWPLRTGGKYWGLLIIVFNVANLENELASLLIMLSIVALILVATLFALLHVMIGQLTRSLRALSSALESYEIGAEKGLAVPETDDEVGILVHSFQNLEKRLSRSRVELLEVQRQVHHAEKLASIGRLASGVAHEINNPLHGIRNCIRTIAREPDNRSQTREYCELADEALSHIETTVKKLLRFARRQAVSKVPVSLSVELEKVVSLLQYRLSKNQVEIERLLPPDLPPVSGDPDQVQEVFMNLLLNSLDALTEGGRIVISAERRGAMVELTVADNGCGIDTGIIGRIFDPFFTTKEKELGTGLGLSVVLGIVESMGGSISVKSGAGEGTTFSIILPAEVNHANSADRR